MTADPRELHVLQLALECKAIVDGDRLVRIPGDEPDEIEGIQVVKYPDGSYRVLVREDVDEELYATIARVGADATFERPDALGFASWSRLRSYVFPADLERPTAVLETQKPVHEADHIEPWMLRPAFEIQIDGECVSYCRSSRENDRCAEAWVETDPEHRRRGFARDAVAAWACSVRDHGKVAFYSHDEDNVASAGLAKSLGLEPFMFYVNLETSETP